MSNPDDHNIGPYLGFYILRVRLLKLEIKKSSIGCYRPACHLFSPAMGALALSMLGILLLQMIWNNDEDNKTESDKNTKT